jgi:2-haloacid dehalogenase
MSAPDVLAFGLIESVLDLRSLRPLFQRLFGEPELVDDWFGETILYSETATITNTFVPFEQLGAAVFRMLAAIHRVAISEADVAELKAGLATLSPYSDAPAALQRLKTAGYRLVTLVDSQTMLGQGPLKAAGLEHLFELQFSAESVARYKPSIDTYSMVARTLQVGLGAICMVSSHPWDLLGAAAAGCSVALIERAGVAPFGIPGFTPPALTGPTLSEIADQLVTLKHA